MVVSGTGIMTGGKTGSGGGATWVGIGITWAADCWIGDVGAIDPSRNRDSSS